MTESPEPRPAPNHTLITAIATIVALVIGLVAGFVIGRATAPAHSTPQAPGTTQAGPTQPGTAAPTRSPEQEEAILKLIRSQARRDPSDQLAKGDVNAPVVIVEYADYRCKYCGTWTLQTLPKLEQLIKDGVVRLEWRDFPIFQQDSVRLAVAARAAAKQGKFWEYNRQLFSYQFQEGKTDLSDGALVKLAETVGVADIAAFRTALTDSSLQAAVKADYDASLKLLGQPSTPQFLVGDTHVPGADTAENFLKLIEQERAKVKK